MNECFKLLARLRTRPAKTTNLPRPEPTGGSTQNIMQERMMGRQAFRNDFAQHRYHTLRNHTIYFRLKQKDKSVACTM